METTYLTITGHHMTVFRSMEGEEASGGSRVCFTRLPRARVPQIVPPAGKIVDFTAYLDRTDTEEETAAPEAVREAGPVLSRRERWGLILDLLATAAIIGMTAGAAIGFLGWIG
ncbi:hypothetical protein [Pseudoflavonifractor sp. MSJ-37]|uniref:hypothetical protein n=1 Tax=Pseudoflavonifractor sp. MSJ-37 TaxID=2841531 RepID=UPI001C0F5C26|nr:hypothetical protein [Pseudoflavonifractor sp. MSJ-37]MBU5435263.1 hypothetical protein [Pseudoflavonifractor sp. MSJ-37]